MLLQVIYSCCLTRGFAEHDELREHAGREKLRRDGTATQVFIFAGMDADEKIHTRVHTLQDTLRFGEIAYLIADDYLRRKGSECCQNTNILWIACQNIGEADIALRASAARSGYLSALVNYCYAIISAAGNARQPACKVAQERCFARERRPRDNCGHDSIRKYRRIYFIRRARNFMGDTQVYGRDIAK